MPLGDGPGDDGIELLSDPRFQEKRRRRFGDLALDLVGDVLLVRAMSRQNHQFIRAIGRGLSFEGGFQQALRYQIGIATIGAVEWV